MGDVSDLVEQLNTARDVVTPDWPVAPEAPEIAVPRRQHDAVVRQLSAEIAALRVENAHLRHIAEDA